MTTTLIDEISRGITPVFAPLTVQQFHQMISDGILLEGAPIELIDGILIRKDRRDKGGDVMTVGPRHATTVKLLGKTLDRVLIGLNCHGQTQQPITLNGLSEPEPDGCIVQGQVEDYASHHPGPAEIAVVIAVADSSLEYDRTTKQRLYAAAGIPVYWIINLRDDVVEVFFRPSPLRERYEDEVHYRAGDEIPLDPGGQRLTVAVDDLL